MGSRVGEPAIRLHSTELVLAAERFAIDVRNDWIPDVVQYRDLASRTRCLMAGRSAPVAVRVPKPNGTGDRLSIIPSPHDRLLFQAYVQQFAPLLPSGQSFSARLRYPNSRAFIVSPRRQWQNFERAVAKARESQNWTATADIKDFFGSISHQHIYIKLKGRLEGSRTDNRKAIQALEYTSSLLSNWFPSGLGLPQNAIPSSVMADRYLDAVVDTILQDEADQDSRALRYMDDYLLMSGSRKALIGALQRLSEIAVRSGLSMNPGKEQISSPREGPAPETAQRQLSRIRRLLIEGPAPSQTRLVNLVHLTRSMPALAEPLARHISARGTLAERPARAIVDVLQSLPYTLAWTRMWLWRSLFGATDERLKDYATLNALSSTPEEIERSTSLCLAALGHRLGLSDIQNVYDRASTYSLRRACVWSAHFLGHTLSGLHDDDAPLAEWLDSQDNPVSPMALKPDSGSYF